MDATVRCCGENAGPSAAALAGWPARVDAQAGKATLEVDGPARHIEALSLRLHNPQSHQWRLNFSNAAAGNMATPTMTAVIRAK